jgi:hypothetical protein
VRDLATAKALPVQTKRPPEGARRLAAAPQWRPAFTSAITYCSSLLLPRPASSRRFNAVSISSSWRSISSRSCGPGSSCSRSRSCCFRARSFARVVIGRSGISLRAFGAVHVPLSVHAAAMLSSSRYMGTSDRRHPGCSVVGNSVIYCAASRSVTTSGPSHRSPSRRPSPSTLQNLTFGTHRRIDLRQRPVHLVLY